MSIKKSKIGVGEIADFLGVSKSTVSRALNNSSKISVATKEKVKKAAIKLGYKWNVPDLMVSDEFKVIVALVPEIESSYYRNIIQGIASYIKPKAYHLLLSPLNNAAEEVEMKVQMTHKVDVSGVVLAIFDERIAIADIMAGAAANLPMVILHQGKEDVNIDKVIPDIFQGVIKATDYLIKNKCEYIALLLHSPEDVICAEMLNGFKSAYTESNTDFEKSIVLYGNNDKTQWKRNLNELFSGGDFPDAIITRTEFMAHQLMAFLKDKDIQTPENVMIISLNANSDSPLYSPGIASIQADGNQIGADAARLLINRIENPELNYETVIEPVNFILKGSAIRMRK